MRPPPPSPSVLTCTRDFFSFLQSREGPVTDQVINTWGALATPACHLSPTHEPRDASFFHLHSRCVSVSWGSCKQAPQRGLATGIYFCPDPGAASLRSGVGRAGSSWGQRGFRCRRLLASGGRWQTLPSWLVEASPYPSLESQAGRFPCELSPPSPGPSAATAPQPTERLPAGCGPGQPRAGASSRLVGFAPGQL